MIGCMLLAAAGLFVAARVVHGRRFGYGRCGGGGWGHHRWGGHHHHHHHRSFGPYGHGFGPGPGPANDGWGGHGPHGGGEGGEEWMDEEREWGGRGWGGRGGSFFLRGLASQLEASPAQQEVLKKAVDELREAGSKLKGEGKKTRADLAAAFRRGSFDEVAMGELYARHDAALEELRKAFVGAGARVHEALDEKQRARLAELIEKGPRWFGRSSWARRDW